jgi:hypothetical protein
MDSTIYVLHYQESIYERTYEYYFSNTKGIVDFICKQKWALPWQTVVVIQVDTNKRQPVYIKGHPEPCNAFAINKYGDTKPLNVHRILNPS